MKSYQFFFMVLAALCLYLPARAQERINANRQFTGAVAGKDHYRAIYQLDQSSPDVVKKAIRNINNLLEDPRLKGKIEVELVTFSGGTEVLRTTSEYGEALKELVNKGVIVAQCLNSLRERKIDKSELFDFIGYVPSGNGELVIRAADGWAIVKP